MGKIKNVRDTSKLSYINIKTEGITGKEEKCIYEFIAKSKIPLTRCEIAFGLKKEKSSVSARINALLEKGVLIEGRKREDRFSGRLGKEIIVKPVDYLF